MPSAPVTRKLLLPLLKRRNDLVLGGRHLAMVPVSSFVRGIFFERCSDPTAYVPYLFAAPLCVCGGFSFHFGNFFRRGSLSFYQMYPQFEGEDHPLSNSTYVRYWSTGDDDYPNAMLRAVEDEMLPAVEAMDSLDKVARAFASNDRSCDRPYMQRSLAWIEVMHGRFGGMAANRFNHARMMLEKYQPGLADRLLQLGDDLPVEDKQAILRILHEREADAIRTMKLEKHWIPTPFPAEERGLV